MEKGYAICKLENISNVPQEPGATTFLYEHVSNILAQKSKEQSLPIRYHFYTNNPSMMEWAKNEKRGMAVFAWDELIDNGNEVCAIKTFYPPVI